MNDDYDGQVKHRAYDVSRVAPPGKRGAVDHVRQKMDAMGPREWLPWVAGPALLAASVAFHFSATRASSVVTAAPREMTYIRSERPRYGLLDGSRLMPVEVFDAASGKWQKRRKDYVKPGEEFRVLGTLCKQVMYDGLSEIRQEIDVTLLGEAVRGYNGQSNRPPTPDDVVYVFGLSQFGLNLSECGFQTLRYVAPEKTFRFQGRVYRTEPGGEPNAVRVVVTGKTLPKAGGDPDAGPLELFVLTEYTRNSFQNRLCRMS